MKTRIYATPAVKGLIRQRSEKIQKSIWCDDFIITSLDFGLFRLMIRYVEIRVIFVYSRSGMKLQVVLSNTFFNSVNLLKTVALGAHLYHENQLDFAKCCNASAYSTMSHKVNMVTL